LVFAEKLKKKKNSKIVRARERELLWTGKVKHAIKKANQVGNGKGSGIFQLFKLFRLLQYSRQF